MARRKQEDPPAGAPLWMNTFSDLMNLLLCFFVLLFSMSSVDAGKLEAVVASLQASISILPSGGSGIGDGELISAGVRQLEYLDSYYNEMANSKAEDSEEQTEGTKKSVEEQYEQKELEESEKMADNIQDAIDSSSLSGKVTVDFNAEYVKLNLNGSILFESGKAELVSDAIPVVDKIGKILQSYPKNVVEVEGHTDNVPIHSAKYENNEVLSMYRALAVTDRLRKNDKLDPKYIKFAGRGDYVPVADNGTAEGRAQNRRVEIKIYNSYNSDVGEN